MSHIGESIARQFAEDLEAEVNRLQIEGGALPDNEMARGVLRDHALLNLAPKAWRCFHCDDVFTDRAAALEHFGSDQGETPACKLNERDGGLVAIVREQAAEIRRMANEDTPTHREFFMLGTQAAADVRAAEDAGYAKALEQVAKPLVVVINKEATRLAESFHPTNVSAARRNLLLAVHAVGLEHYLSDDARHLPGRYWKHKRRGSTYREIGTARVQSSTHSIHEGDELVVYQSVVDATLWARPPAEFRDGRFELLFQSGPLPPAPPPAPSAPECDPAPFPGAWQELTNAINCARW